jgi:hypothetical protein
LGRNSQKDAEDLESTDGVGVTEPIKARLVPLGSKVITECSDGSTNFHLGRLDGFYHNSKTENGGYVLCSMIEMLVKVGEGEYRLATNEELGE